MSANERAAPPLPAGFVAVPREESGSVKENRARELATWLNAFRPVFREHVSKVGFLTHRETKISVHLDEAIRLLREYADFLREAHALQQEAFHRAERAPSPIPPAVPVAEGLHRIARQIRECADEGDGKGLQHLADELESMGDATQPAEASAQGGEADVSSDAPLAHEGLTREQRWTKWARELTHWRLCMSYNESYFGEPMGKLKQITNAFGDLLFEGETPAPPTAPERAEGYLEVKFPSPILAMREYNGRLLVLCEDGAYFSDGKTYERIDPAAPQAAVQGEAVIAVTDAMVERACKAAAMYADGAVFPDAYSDEEVAGERASMRRALTAVFRSDGPGAYCIGCQNVGMRNCANFTECSGATCISCLRPFNTAPPAPADLVARLEGLAKEWDARSERADKATRSYDDHHPALRDAYDRCADELRAALAGVK